MARTSSQYISSETLPSIVKSADPSTVVNIPIKRKKDRKCRSSECKILKL